MATTAKTFKYKMYASARNRKIHQQINAAGMVYNHCITLHERYYSLYHKSLNKFALQKHLTKLKRVKRFSYLKEIGSQAVQDITDRIARAYKLFVLRSHSAIHCYQVRHNGREGREVLPVYPALP